MFSFFKKKTKNNLNLDKDIHSHLLPGIDDGVQSISEALKTIKKFKELGYTKLVTTPHILHDFYNNTPEIIAEKLSILKSAIDEEGIDMEVEAAAEYYMDEHFLSLIENENELLTFGDKYLLFETGFMNEPINLNEIIFKLKSKGYNPVMAHPERYGYITQKFNMVEDLINRGVLMQLNINSLSGYYSKEIKKTAEKLIDNEFVHFLGSDCHNMKQLEVLETTIDKKYYNKALELSLLNHSL